ncbi:MAG: EAL domain-containing protein [Gammaproteobacteria bacterium]|nr:EAL domain-containing protein [Gammaproteobacteria bacterium]
MFKELINSDTQALDQLRNAFILIADERSNEQGSLYEMLRESGFTRLTQSTSRDRILDTIREGYRHESQQVALFIISTSIEEFDALELTRTLSQHDVSNTPILFLSQSSGWLNDNQLVTSYQSGAIDILNRPLRVAEVIPRINLALQYRQEKQRRLLQEENLNTKLSERRVMEVRLEHLLNHDELTALPSRHRLEAALKISLSKTHNLHRTCALIYIDIDHFRIINDALGHSRGDKLLVRMADLLKHSSPDNALIARIGSDEFAILIDDIDELVAMDLAHVIDNELENLICGESGDPMQVFASIGVVMIHPGTDNKTASEVLARGDQACNIAKNDKSTRVYLFNHNAPEIKSLQKTRQCVALVRKALINDWFKLYLQPIVSLGSDKTSHYEVLVRLIDSNNELHSPEHFVPAAENTGLINKLDFWVVDHALSLLDQLQKNQTDFALSINLSGDGLQTPAILELIKNKINYLSLNPSRIMFELTETAAVSDVRATRATISKLRALGCRFAIDDFGTGFSSFSYIKNYPVDYIKIDGIFIQNLINEPSDQILVKSMVDIAHNLGKKVIAEYVEDAATQELLRGYGVDYVQGYHLGKPVPAEQILNTLRY